jgi:hypothetical protein
MSGKALALPAIAQPSPADSDFDAICATVMASERGRRFLEEYARRSRATDTRVLLDAIRRIEGVVRAERSQRADLELRSDLLDMATAIAQTRAEVTAIKPKTTGTLAETPHDVFAAAERLKEVAWAMRERGLDFATCGQIEELASAVLSASALRDPADRRAHKLAEVLTYLEARIGSMINACAPAVIPPGSAAQGSEPGLPDIEADLFETPAETASATVLANEADATDVGTEASAPAPTPVVVQGAARIAVPTAPSKSPPMSFRPLGDPLTALRALSDEERIALFT